MEYILLTTAALLLAVMFALNKIYQKSAGDSVRASLSYSSLNGIFTAVIFFCINGFHVDITMYSLIMAAALAALVMCYTIFGFKLLKSGSMALYTVFLMIGGMTLPYIYGLIFLDEPFSVMRTIALIMLFAGVTLTKYGSGTVTVKQLMMCIAVFVLNGFTSIVSKQHQIEQNFSTIATTDFIILNSMFKFVFAGIWYLFCKKEDANESKDMPKIILVILLSAVVSGVSSLLQLSGASTLPATVLYPFVTGGSIIFTAIIGRIFFSERLTKRLVIGIAVCFIGTILFL